jgi:hypothetical protein
MPAGRAYTAVIFACALALPAIAQSVISTHSGIIYYFDGAISLNDQPLEPHPGKFTSMPQGAELRTAQGRAEVLLTPGVFLRMGEQGAVRMLANDLANTRVELLAGSAIVDSGVPNPGTAVTVVFKNWQIRSAQAGSYRIDSDPPRLSVLRGEAEVAPGPRGQPVTVKGGMDLPLSQALVPEQSGIAPADSLNAWDQGRTDSILADNAITQQIDGDPSSQTGDLDGFSYFPFLGVSLGSLSYGPYGSALPGQPGFYSVYLPGYTRLPVLFGLTGRRLPGSYPVIPLRTGVPLLPPRVGASPGVGSLGRPLPTGPRPVAPAHPIARPIIHR